MRGPRRSQSAIVGGLIVTIAILAAIGAMIYELQQYKLASDYAAEKQEIVGLSQELERNAMVSAYVSGNSIYVSLNESGFPYEYSVVGISVLLSNGSPLLLQGNNTYGVTVMSTVYAPQGSYQVKGLPIPVDPLSVVSINLTFPSGLSFSRPPYMSLLLQSGYSIASIMIRPYLTVSSISALVAQHREVVTKLVRAIPVVSPHQFKIAVPVPYLVVNATPIILYNPSSEVIPAGTTVNLTINLTNSFVSKYSQNLIVGSRTIPLANVLFASLNSSGWAPLNAWLEYFNSTEATVWVKLDQPIQPYENLTIYLLFLNATDLGTTTWGVNSYYTHNVSLDNIGYVMQNGIDYQIYVSTNGTLYESGGGVGAQASYYCANEYSGSMIGFSYVGLGKFIYQLPLYNADSYYKDNEIYCVIYNGPLSGIPTYSSREPSISFKVVNDSTLGVGPESDTFISYSTPLLYPPANEPVYVANWSSWWWFTQSFGQLEEGYNVLFNYQDEFIGGQPWPYGLYEAQQEVSWLVKGIGWVQVLNPNEPIATTTDDGTAMFINSIPGGGSFTNWLGRWPGMPKAVLPIWATDYGFDTWNSPVTFVGSINSSVSSVGDYRVVIEYYQDIGTDTYFAVFSLEPVTYSWYAPALPPGGMFPLATDPLDHSLLVGPQPIQGWIVG